MNYAYIRVSTESQTVENQRIVISDYAKKSGVRKLEWVAETISGTKAPDDRKLGGLLKKVQEGDAIICTEISRLGRSMVMIMTILDYCLKKKVKVRWPTMKSFVTVNMFIKPKRRSVKRDGEKELTSGKLRYKLKEWIFKKF